ncbi:hypothetical protein GYMLUDRAFT_236886 [Collybiopsis luxurians FD-317 M1]|nr:hypothetical protein GYMLUDRAFT_236886 [Collybiopsis luxurians FD-317 M1]
MILLDDCDENASLKARVNGVPLSESVQTEMTQLLDTEDSISLVSNPYSAPSVSDLPPPYLSRTSLSLPSSSSNSAVDPEAQHEDDSHSTSPRRRRKAFKKRLKKPLIFLLAMSLIALVTFSDAWIAEWNLISEWNLSDQDPNSMSNVTLNILEEELGLACVKNASWSGGVRRQESLSSADTSFEIPLSDVASFALFSRGPGISGEVRIIDFGLDSNVAKVYVTITPLTKRLKLKDRVRVCLVEGSSGPSSGLGIFSSAPNDANDEDLFHFEVTVLLPSSNGETNFDFLTNLPKFAHKFETEDLVFRSVDITTSGKSVVSVSPLRADILSIKTSDGPIKGVFNASQSLIIQTSNNYIDANVTLFNDGVEPTRLAMSNSGSASSREIRSTINLLSQLNILEHPKYNIAITAPNTELKLMIPSTPPHADLRLHASTTEKASVVSLSSQYEGHFFLESTGFGHSPVLLDAAADGRVSSSGNPEGPITQLIESDGLDEGRLVLEGSRRMVQSDVPRDALALPLTSSLKVTTRNAHNTLILLKVSMLRLWIIH